MEMRHTDAFLHEKAEGNLQISLHDRGGGCLEALSSLLYFQHEKVSDFPCVLFQKWLRGPQGRSRIRDRSSNSSYMWGELRARYSCSLDGRSCGGRLCRVIAHRHVILSMELPREPSFPSSPWVPAQHPYFWDNCCGLPLAKASPEEECICAVNCRAEMSKWRRRRFSTWFHASLGILLTDQILQDVCDQRMKKANQLCFQIYSWACISCTFKWQMSTFVLFFFKHY